MNCMSISNFFLYKDHQSASWHCLTNIIDHRFWSCQFGGDVYNSCWWNSKPNTPVICCLWWLSQRFFFHFMDWQWLLKCAVTTSCCSARRQKEGIQLLLFNWCKLSAQFNHLFEYEGNLVASWGCLCILSLLMTFCH